MLSLMTYAAAALAKIADALRSMPGFARIGRLRGLPRRSVVVLCAYLLIRVDSAAAGRAYAAYGSIYIAAAVLWLWCAVIFSGPHRV
ncbi:hypothetical protein NPJ82_17815 (plasmid) [Sphingomonas sp. NY01]|uniref:hypothetical protein n=1 Tax=Sphingomonas sp. NY01 TaxID=2968057 RepID=UPI00315C5E66